MLNNHLKFSWRLTPLGMHWFTRSLTFSAFSLAGRNTCSMLGEGAIPFKWRNRVYCLISFVVSGLKSGHNMSPAPMRIAFILVNWVHFSNTDAFSPLCSNSSVLIAALRNSIRWIFWVRLFFQPIQLSSATISFFLHY